MKNPMWQGVNMMLGLHERSTTARLTYGLGSVKDFHPSGETLKMLSSVGFAQQPGFQPMIAIILYDLV